MVGKYTERILVIQFVFDWHNFEEETELFLSC